MILEVLAHGQLTPLLWPAAMQSDITERVWRSRAVYLIVAEKQREIKREEGARYKP